MTVTPEAQQRTRAFARVLGPYIACVTTILVFRMPSLASGTFLQTVFSNEAIVWMLGAGLLLGGLIILACHPHWHSPTAVMVSALGWFVALRGLVMLVAPQLIQRGAAAALPDMRLVQAGFGALALMGLWLTYAGWIARPRD